MPKASGCRALLLVASLVVAAGLPALAQSAEEEDGAEAPAAEAEAGPSQDVDMSGIDVDKLDWSQLNVDASTLAYSGSKGGAPRRADGGDATWSAKDRVGGTAVSVKQSISPFWDTRIGADMTVVRAPATMSELLAEKTANGGNLPQSAGSAWAAVTAPGAGPLWDKTAVEARLDPSQEQSRFGTSLSKSLPLDEQYSLTLQNGYNLIQQGLVPLPGIAPHPSRNYQTDQSARLSIGNTGTSIIAGQTLSSADDRWLRRIGAEQQLFEGVSVSGTIGETPQGATSKSLTAGFKRTW